MSGQDLSNKDVQSGRVNVTIKWGESSKLKLIADDTLDNSNASGGQRLNDYLAPQLSNPFDMYNDMPVNRDFSHRNGESATYTQSLTDQLGLKVVAAYIEGRSQQFINFAELDENLFEVPGAYHDQQSSGEAQLTFKNPLVNAVGGLFYMDSTACGSYNASIGTLSGTLPPTVAPPLGIYITELVSGCVLTKSYAVYGDSSWKLTDKLDLDAGMRWNEDDKTAHVYQNDYTSFAPTQLLPGQQLFNPATVPAGFFPDVVTDYNNSRAFVNFTPRFGFDYHFTDRVMGYLTYSRGFKSGGFDMRGNAAVYPQTQGGYGSETADNYEAGLKTTLLDDTLLFNLTVFYNPYSNAQIPIQEFVTYNGAPTNLTAELNAGKQINQGVEIESVWRPIKRADVRTQHRLFGFVLQGFFDRLQRLHAHAAAAAGASRRSMSRMRIGRSTRRPGPYPAMAPTLGISPRAHCSPALGYDWRSFIKVAATFQSPTDQPAYGLLNGGFAFTTTSKAWRFSIDGKNLTNRYYRVAGYDFGPPPIGPANSFIGGVSQIGYYGPPRTVTGTVTYHF